MSHGQATYSIDQVDAAAAFIASGLAAQPKVAILTGTGLADMTRAVQNSEIIPYANIPHFPLSTVQTHTGRLVSGTIAGLPVLICEGRFHLYEGYSPRAVTFPIRVTRKLGIGTLILTNASGGLNPAFAAGDIMVIADHINLTGANPLMGPNEDLWGPRFPDMTRAYDPLLRRLAKEEGEKLDLPVRQGVYIGLNGPSLETPAEMRFLKTIGADAVGFSTVMETIAAVHAGLDVLGLSIITNMCLPDALATSSVNEIIAVAQSAAPRLVSLIEAVLTRLEANHDR